MDLSFYYCVFERHQVAQLCRKFISGMMVDCTILRVITQKVSDHRI